MLNLFKREWLPDYVRKYMLKKFPPEKHYKISFKIDGKILDLAEVVGNERKLERAFVTFTDSEGQSREESLYFSEELNCSSVDRTLHNFIQQGIDTEFRPNVRIGKKDDVEKKTKALGEKLSEVMDYCPGSPLDSLHEYPLTDFPRWKRKRLLNLLANMSENSIPVFVSFDLDGVTMDQLDHFEEELELAMMVENKYTPQLDDEEGTYGANP